MRAQSQFIIQLVAEYGPFKPKMMPASKTDRRRTVHVYEPLIVLAYED